MFGWFKRKNISEVHEETKKGFDAVKYDIEAAGKWIKHLDEQDKQLFDSIFALREELTSIRDEMGGLREAVEMVGESQKDKQVFKKTSVLSKQTTDYDVVKGVQTGVQTGGFYGILSSLSANERLLVLTLMNNDMKLSYEDLALLLGKERATIRGQINAIKQKSEGLIEEIVEKNGKKRVYVPEEIKEKLQKYAKVRVKGKKKE